MGINSRINKLKDELSPKHKIQYKNTVYVLDNFRKNGVTPEFRTDIQESNHLYFLHSDGYKSDYIIYQDGSIEFHICDTNKEGDVGTVKKIALEDLKKFIQYTIMFRLYDA